MGGSASQSGLAHPDHNLTEALPNPLRSLGDALKQIKQQFDEILGARNTEVPNEPASNPSVPSQLEYLRPDEQDQDMQALGPAGDEQAAKLEQLHLIDDDMIPDGSQEALMDVDEVYPEEALSKISPEETAPTSVSAVDKATVQRAKDDLSLADQAKLDDPVDDLVETELREWRSANYPEGGADHIWRLYESLTHELAYALCEQLRLILQPTLATRLRGDYRTGKRLNMKKVIAYIASDYTKDKIWLRRTKPSQREYQVLISIDDSRSMSETHSVHLAFQTLALISKALTRLESGDVAIAKFGEGVDILRGFDEGPLPERTGAQIINAFRFDQKATNVLSLMEASLQFLEAAREKKATSSASSADLWQIQFVISDGMCQDHDKIRRLLRRAEEQRVMIVFIVLDSHQKAPTNVPPSGTAGAQHSILNMEKVDFKIVDGKMELVQQKYLDTFPFEYYVVLHKVEALPEVLSETLKQFFERISEE